MVFDSTTLFGSLRPAAPICCRHSVIRGLPFCFFVFPALQLYCTLFLLPAMFSISFFSLSSVSGNEPVIMHAHATASFLLKHMKPWKHFTFQMAKWADRVLSWLTNPINPGKLYHTAHFVLLNMCPFPCVVATCFESLKHHFWPDWRWIALPSSSHDVSLKS